jgi:hypothetical protein
LPDDAFEDSNCDGIDGDKTAAVFVSPKGTDSADGSFDAPVKTIMEGVALASKQSKAVYVCVADYAENIVVDTTAVSIFGGYDCSDWSRGNARPTVVPPSGIPLSVTHVTGVTVDRMAFTSADATTAGGSSIGALVVASTDVKWSHIQVDAGAGAAGVPGDAVLSVTSHARDGAVGQDSTFCSVNCVPTRRLGGNNFSTQCGTVPIHGGAGGAGATTLAGQFAPGTGDLGTPGIQRSGGSGVAGLDGAPGMPAASGFGVVSEAGYLPSNSGADGSIASVGESGGGGVGGFACGYYNTAAECRSAPGGSGNQFWGGGGGQGGYAGCGGVGGRGGSGGGASIAVLSINSKLSLSWASLSTAAGGIGGVPSDGASGQPGGVGGKGGQPSPDNLAAPALKAVTAGQNGGDGGDGGKGGPGGPGGGGPSVTVVALGDAPLMQAMTLTPGPGGKGAAGLSGQDAADGESRDIKVIDAAPADGGA